MNPPSLLRRAADAVRHAAASALPRAFRRRRNVLALRREEVQAEESGAIVLINAATEELFGYGGTNSLVRLLGCGCRISDVNAVYQVALYRHF